MEDAQQPLAGIRVLDLSRFIAGPLCTMLLADMGAEVIKVERPGGEDARAVAPFWNGESVYAMTYNRNKRAITLDTRSSDAQHVLGRLADWADVVVENYRPGTLEAMGIGYPALSEKRPEIIVTSISGYGQTGPMRDRALFDCIAQAVSGVMARNGEPEDAPELTGIFVGDHLTGIYAAYGTVLALVERWRSGRGQHVDVAVLDSLFSCLGPAVPAYLMLGQIMPRTGNRDAFAAPANLFQASDGYVYAHAGTPSLFRRFCTTILEQPELLEDPRFASVEARMENVELVEGLMRDWMAGRTAAEAELELASAGIPAAAVADVAGATANVQLRERGMMVEIPTEGGTIAVPGNPVRLSRTPANVGAPPPRVGQHTAEVLSEVLGLSHAEIEALSDTGAI